MLALKKLLFIHFLLIAFQLHPYQKTIITINASQVDASTWYQLRDLFVAAFQDAYKQTSIENINNNFTSVSDYLYNCFDTDLQILINLNFDIAMVVEDHEILGYNLFCYIPEDKKIFIKHLAVRPNKYRMGIGRALLEASENHYKQADHIILSTRKYNVSALDFYEHMGFYTSNDGPKIAYVIRPTVKNNPQIIWVEKKINRH